MIDTLRIYNELKVTMEPAAAEKIADAIGMIYEELRYAVTKTEFNELRDVVAELAEAQKRTEQRVEELAEAQKRTEQRVAELAVSLTRLERKVEDLVGEMKVFKKELGGLAHTVGYRLEDEAIKALPRLLKKDHAIEIEGSLIRDYFEIGPNRYVELNIWGRGIEQQHKVEIIGEAKSQLKKRDVDGFLQTIKTVEPFFNNRIVPILVTYQTSPQVREYAKAKGINLYFSYQL